MYKVGKYVEDRDPSEDSSRSDQFCAGLGPHPACPQHGGRRQLTERQREIRTALLTQEAPDSAYSKELDELQLPMPPASGKEVVVPPGTVQNMLQHVRVVASAAGAPSPSSSPDA